jgi:hypothetical protein
MVRALKSRPDRIVLPTAATWDGEVAADSEIAAVTLAAAPGGLRVEIEAPFHADPPPAAALGPCDGLWEHEVVELFVAGPGEHYLEVEVGPHGHYLVLRLDGIRRRAGPPVELESGVEAAIERGRWRGAAVVPWSLLPPGPHRVNAYAVHGAAPRRYLAYAPVPGPAPDFHRLERFVAVELPGAAGPGENFPQAGDPEGR